MSIPVKFTMLAFAATLLFTTCNRKEKDSVVGQSWVSSLPAGASVNALLKELAPNAETKSVTLVPGTIDYEIIFNNGLRLDIAEPITTTSGTRITTGTLTVSAVLARTRGDLIRSNVPTVSNGKLLVTGGAFNLSASVNGQPVSMAYSFSLNQPVERNSYLTFFGESLPNNSFNWVVNPDSAMGWPIIMDSAAGIVDSTNHPFSYCCFSKMGWINCDYFYNSTQPLTSVKVLLPIQYTNQNTVTYLVFKDIRSVASLWGNATSYMFETGSGYEVPIGMNVKVVSISKIGSEYFLGTRDIALPDNQIITVTPVQKTKQEVDDIINAL